MTHCDYCGHPVHSGSCFGRCEDCLQVVIAAALNFHVCPPLWQVVGVEVRSDDEEAAAAINDYDIQRPRLLHAHNEELAARAWGHLVFERFSSSVLIPDLNATLSVMVAKVVGRCDAIPILDVATPLVVEILSGTCRTHDIRTSRPQQPRELDGRLH